VDIVSFYNKIILKYYKMNEKIQSQGMVKTVVNGEVIQNKEYGLDYDGNKMDFAFKDGNKKLILGRLEKEDISKLLSNKNEKKCLKENLESLLPKNMKLKKNYTKKHKKKKRITLKIEEKPKKRKKSRKKKKKNNKLKDFLDFLN